MINGIRAKDVIGRSIYDLIDEGVFEGAVTPEILRTKRQYSTLSYNKKTQKRVLVTGKPILDDNGNVSLIVSNERDLTHWNAVKADLERSRKVAEKYKDELEQLTRQEHFRKDLFFRLNTFRIHIPPLRHRPDDVIKMIEYFLDMYNKK